MSAAGPLGRDPAGRFNFAVPAPAGQALYLEPSPKRVRVTLAGETVADSRRVMLLHESGQQPVYYFPRSDVRMDLLQPCAHRTTCPWKGEAIHWTIGAVQEAAWSYEEIVDGAPDGLAGLVAFYWNRMEAWFEEDEQVHVHPRDPYHRVDVRRTARRVRISRGEDLLAESARAVALFESNLPARWYLPAEDVAAGLEPSDTVSRCPYKGQAGYYSVRLASGRLIKDLVWYYAEPFDEVSAIRGLVCFYNERVDVSLDGEPQARPVSPWGSGGQNAPVAQTRG